jgi:hypothetical protein
LLFSKNQISEDGGVTWHDMPSWVTFFINQGMKWPNYSSSQRGRQIRLISMPCQSHAAGLVALGAVGRDICDPTANDKARHIDGLMRYASQYLNHCRDCKLTICNPEFKRCGFRSRASGRIFKAKSITRFRIHPESQPRDGVLKLLQVQRNGKEVPVNVSGIDYYYDCYPEGAIALEEGIRGGRIDINPLSQILGNLLPIDGNLSVAYSGLCLAGSPRFGSSETKRFNLTFKFSQLGGVSLADLFPIKGWGVPRVPRLVFLNTRGEVSFSHMPVSPRLVIADGVGAFLKCIDHPILSGANILAVIRRDGRRDSDEDLSAKLNSLLQWYDRRRVQFDVPAGVSIVDYVPIT